MFTPARIQYILLLIMAALIMAGCQSRADEAEQIKTIPVQIAAVKIEERALPILRSGRLSAAAEKRLSFKTGGIVDRIYVNEGDAVKAGQLLAELAPQEIEAQLRKAQGVFEKAKRDMERVERLFRDSVATLEQQQNAATGLKIAAANLEIARFNRKHSRIHAPADGKILKKMIEPNELIAPGTPALFFGATGPNWIVRLGLSDAEILRVQLGDKATATFRVYSGVEFSGVVSEVAQAADLRHGGFEIEVTIRQNEYPLKSGFVAEVEVFTSRKEQRHVIPVEALLETDGSNAFVYAYNPADGAIRRTAIVVDHIFAASVAVAEGLENVEHVVSKGSPYLTDQSTVHVVNQ
jgi:RND family efflux transporter MFP subunit